LPWIEPSGLREHESFRNRLVRFHDDKLIARFGYLTGTRRAAVHDKLPDTRQNRLCTLDILGRATEHDR
jgi:hypothetical protein